MKPTTTILKDCAVAFKSARQGLLQGAALLSTISKDKLWENDYTSFGEYVEQECQISQGYASKLITAYEHYVVQGGLSHAKLSATDPEKLYLAIKLIGTPEEQAVKAETLTRTELKQEIVSQDGVECAHPTHITICSQCHVRV